MIQSAQSESPSGAPLLDVRDLRVHFRTEEGIVRAVDGISLSLEKNQTLGIVGESGCGKSATAYAIMRLIPEPPGRIAGGGIFFQAPGSSGPPVDLVSLNPRGDEIRAIRGNDIAMIFQEPMTSLSPVHTIGNQIGEAIRLHQRTDRRETRARTIEVLRKVRLPNPERQVDAYPHELSGGMRQRAMIAMALSCNPCLLIGDEPTTALDVTVQADILDLIDGLQQDTGMSLLLITHDLGVIARMADIVAVMYLGKIVEFADVKTLFRNPRHPYTRGLLESLPRMGRKGRLNPIKGSVPDPFDIPVGCSFRPRCPRSVHPDREREEPPLIEIEPGHFTRCCGVCE